MEPKNQLQYESFDLTTCLVATKLLSDEAASGAWREAARLCMQELRSQTLSREELGMAEHNASLMLADRIKEDVRIRGLLSTPSDSRYGMFVECSWYNIAEYLLQEA